MLIQTPQTTKAAKLRILLARIKHKQDNNLALTVPEEELMAECYYQTYSRPKETVEADVYGNVTVHTQVNAEPVMEAMKDYGDVLDKHVSGVAGAKMIGSVDTVTASIWSKECGAAIGTREFAIYAKKKIASPEFKRFRVGGGY